MVAVWVGVAVVVAVAVAVGVVVAVWVGVLGGAAVTIVVGVGVGVWAGVVFRVTTMTKTLTDAEKLRRLREIVRYARLAPLYGGGRILCRGEMIVPMPPVLLISELEAAGIIQRPRKWGRK